MHGFLDGSVLYVDVSGFTSMTERLMAHGHRGAERISSSLNAVFEAAGGALSGSGGFVATFAGDSFTAVFPGVGPDECLRTAKEVRGLLSGLETDPSFRLEYRFCLSAGEMEWGITGAPGMRTFFFRGDPVFACSALAESCAPGELAVDRAETFGISVGSGELEDGPPPRVEESFLPAAALASARTGEFREVVSVFTGFDEDISYGELDGLTRLLLEEAAGLGGYIPGVFFDEKGGNALTLFGAPMAYEHLEERALEYVRALRAPGLLGVRFGVCRGVVYAGRIGSGERFTYSVIGDPVNTAAKLLNHCLPGGALVAYPEQYMPEVGGVLSPAGFVDLAGKSRPVPVAEVGDARPAGGLSRRRESGLVGRGGLLAEGLQAVREAHGSGRPVVVYICGEAGMGKSRLLSELTSAAPPEASRLLVRCDDISRRGMGPVARMLGDYFWISGSGKEVDFQRGWAALMGGVEDVEGSRAAEARAELSRARPALRRLLGLPSGDPVFDSLEPARRYSNTVFAVKTFLKAMSLLSPLLLSVEDLHWADPDTEEVLRTLLRRLEGYPVALLITSRRGDGGTWPELDVPGEVTRKRLVLHRLSLEDSRTLAAGVLGGSPSEALMEFLEARCRGNPFYLEQYCGYLIDRGLTAEAPDGLVLGGDASGMPEGVRSTLLARLDRLPEPLRSLVQKASVLGKDFHLEVLARMVGEEGLEGLMRRGTELGIWTDAGGGACSFSHVLIRDAAYQMQLEDSLRGLHAAAAEAEREVFGDSPDHWARTAYHLERAGLQEEAAGFLLRAGRHAAGEYRNLEALDLYGRYLEMAPGTEASAGREEALAGMARLSAIMGRWERAEELYRRSVEAAGPGSPGGLSRTVELAGFLRSVGRLEEARSLLEGCAGEVESSGDGRLVADHLLARARVQIDMGEYRRGLEQARRAMEACLDSGGTDTSVSACRAMGSAMASMGDSEGALKAYRRALEMVKDRKAPVERAELLGSMGNVHLERQRFDTARDLYARSLELAERVGHRQYIAFATGNLGIVHQLQGRLGRAEELLKRQEIIGRELGDVYTMGTSWMNQSLVQMARGRFREALRLSRSAEGAFREIQDRAGVSYAKALSGNFLAFMGRAEEAAESLAEAVELGRECNLAFYLAEYLVSYAWLLLEMGRCADAEPVARHALQTAEEVGRDRCASRARMALDAAAACLGREGGREALRAVARESDDGQTRGLARYALCLAGGGPEEAKAARREIAAGGGPEDSTGWRVLMGTGGPLMEDGESGTYA